MVSATAGFAGNFTIYAKFDTGTGAWAGTSTAAGRSAWVELESFSFASENVLTIGATTGGIGSGKVTFEEAELLKQIDRLTPQIFGSLASGSHMTDFVVEYVQNTGSGSTPQVVFRAEFKLVGFTSAATQSSAGDSVLKERIKIAYGSMRLTAWPVNPDGTPATASS